ncbi:MAG: hypothetical protein HYV14_03045 [Elusimicrobia bacterium]|nr:hypothetical protein [Elusimicrobiota bacterium]
MPEVIKSKKVVAIEYPRHAETIASNDYTFRVAAMPGVKTVEVSVNEAAWKPCRPSGDFWWYDWSGYGSGEHGVAARVQLSDGRYLTTENRFFTVELANHAAANCGERRTLSPRQARQFLGRPDAHERLSHKHVVVVPNQPAVVRRLTQVLSQEGVNIDSLLIESAGDVASFRFLLEEESGLRETLEGEGFHVVDDKVFRLDLPNRPGEIDRLTRSLMEQGVALRYLYGTSHGETTKVVFAVDRPEEAVRVVKELDRRAEAVAA